MSNPDAAFFANLAYAAPSERQSLINQRYASNEYTIDHRFNTDEHFAAVHKKHGHVYSGHRGTSNLDDLTTDVSLAVGNLTSTDRYKRSFNAEHAVHQFYGTQNVTSVGHSLGGTLAETLARHHGNSSIAYNPGTSPFIKDIPASQQHQRIRTEGDLISSFGSATTTQASKPTPVSDKQHRLEEKTGGYVPHAAAWKLYNAYSSHLLKQFLP